MSSNKNIPQSGSKETSSEEHPQKQVAAGEQAPSSSSNLRTNLEDDEAEIRTKRDRLLAAVEGANKDEEEDGDGQDEAEAPQPGPSPASDAPLVPGAAPGARTKSRSSMPTFKTDYVMANCQNRDFHHRGKGFWAEGLPPTNADPATGVRGPNAEDWKKQASANFQGRRPSKK